MPLLHEHEISVVTRGPLAKGLLSDKMLEKITQKGYQDYSQKELLDVLPVLKDKLAADRSFTEIALQYNLANPAVASVIAGASSPEQVRSNAQSVKSLPLTEQEVSIIKEISKAGIYEEHR